MTASLGKNRWGHDITPELTSDQKAILLREFANGLSVPKAAKEAGCSEPRARYFYKETENAKAIRDLQITNVIVKQNHKLLETMLVMTNTICNLESQVRDLARQCRATTKAVARQKLSLVAAKREIKDMKEDRRKLREFIHKNHGLDLDDVTGR